MHAPRFDYTEALSLVAMEFADCILEDRTPLTDAESGLRVLTAIQSVTGNKMKSQAAGKTGFSTSEIGDLVVDALANATAPV